MHVCASAQRGEDLKGQLDSKAWGQKHCFLLHIPLKVQCLSQGSINFERIQERRKQGQEWKDYLPKCLWLFLGCFFTFIIVLFCISLFFFLQGACKIRKTMTKLFLINKSLVTGYILVRFGRSVTDNRVVKDWERTFTEANQQEWVSFQLQFQCSCYQKGNHFILRLKQETFTLNMAGGPHSFQSLLSWGNSSFLSKMVTSLPPH